MTNFEKYKDDIIKTLFANGSTGIDKKTGELCDCDDLGNCENCQFNGGCESDTLRKWLDSEYVEPKKEEVDWSKVPIDTKILVSDNKVNWYRRYFAGIDRCTSERLAWLDGATSWADRSTRPWKHVKLYKEDEENE